MKIRVGDTEIEATVEELEILNQRGLLAALFPKMAPLDPPQAAPQYGSLGELLRKHAPTSCTCACSPLKPCYECTKYGRLGGVSYGSTVCD